MEVAGWRTPPQPAAEPLREIRREILDNDIFARPDWRHTPSMRTDLLTPDNLDVTGAIHKSQHVETTS